MLLFAYIEVYLYCPIAEFSQFYTSMHRKQCHFATKVLSIRFHLWTLWCFEWWRSGRALASHAGGRGSIHDRDRPMSLKQVVTAPLPNARSTGVSVTVLGDDHYKGLARVTVSVAR